MNFIKTFFLFIISFPFLSRIWGVITKIEKPEWFVRKVIAYYKNQYKIDMNEYAGNAIDYKSLASFFTRQLNADVRPFKENKEYFLSPSDGLITVLQKVKSDLATQVKGKTYKISELIRHDLNFSEGYYLMTIYLSPRDYHRFHVPVDATVKSYIHTGWRLFPVNSFSVNTIEDLFVRNERVVAKLNSYGTDFYYTAVGATFVGSIKMDFFSKPVDGQWTTVEKKYRQNDELGMFEMGSTIVLVIPEKMVKELKVKQGQKVKTGETLFHLNR